MKKNIAVIFGGESTEHDISILTGIQVANALNKQKYNLIPIYISSVGEWFCGKELTNVEFYQHFCTKKLKKVAILPNSDFLFCKKFGRYKKLKKIDCAILACHGKNGEDGTLQGLLQLAKIPYSSGGVFSSSVGLDKQKMKEIFLANKIPICKYFAIKKQQYENGKIDKKNMQFPVIVKPNSLGSSIGISICQSFEQFENAVQTAFCFDDIVLVEECITNLKEVNISVLGDEQSCVCSVTEQPNSNGLLSFEKKYLSSNSTKSCGSKSSKNVCKNFEKNANTKTVKNVGTKNGMQNLDRLVPAKITKKQQKIIEYLAKKIFFATKSQGVVRIDFLIDTKKDKIYANEINTFPGSFAFYLWQKSGLDFDKLLDRIIDISIKNFAEQKKLTTKFSSSVLTKSAKLSK